MLTIVIIVMLIVTVAYILVKIGKIVETLIWNNGVCAATGEPWVRFSIDSTGARGYKSDDHTCWISYKSVDIKAEAITKCDLCDQFGIVHYTI